MNIAIVLSGGIGTRLGANIPKQYIEVQGQPIINYCLKTFCENEKTDAIVIVVADEWREYVKCSITKIHTTKTILFALPGENRQGSIYNALKVIKEKGYLDDDIVLIHDAVRPLVNHKLINNCYNSCQYTDGVMPVIPVKDTTYYSEDGIHIHSLIQRDFLWSGQSPEAFKFGKYLSVHNNMTDEQLLQITGSTEIAFKGGMDCQMIAGDPMNFKITTKEDLSNFESLINKR